MSNDDDERGHLAIFSCRLGLEPYAEPAGKLIEAVIVGLWKVPGAPAQPRFLSLTIRRGVIRFASTSPLTPEQHAAIGGACREFNAALQRNEANATTG